MEILETGKVQVCFRLNGGIGTYLMQENFILCFFEKFSSAVSITVFGSASVKVNDGLFVGQTFVAHYDVRSQYQAKNFDLSIDINWFPDVVHIDRAKVRAISPQLEQLVNIWIAFKKNASTKDFVRTDSLFDPNVYQYAIANGKNRVNVMDIDRQLDIEPEFRLVLQTVKPEKKVLKRFGLWNQKYITLQQGVNADSTSGISPKQWPNENYSILCRMLKERFPGFVLVQLGESGNNRPIDGVDCCLLGETDFEDLKVLLKNSLLHIDGECGMVHMRRALHAGPSVVLFGQTPLRVYGHAEDINISANICGDGCSKLFSSWKSRCYLSDQPLCMQAITPQHVADIVGSFLLGNYHAKSAEKSKLQELLEDERVCLDEEWVGEWLEKRKVYAYWLETVKIRELTTLKLTADGYQCVTVSEMPAYHYLEGDRQSYVNYMVLNDRYNPGHEHSLERFEALLANFQDGVKPKCHIVVNGKNTILDGVHRACWMAHQYGLDTEITILKVYGDWKI